MESSRQPNLAVENDPFVNDLLAFCFPLLGWIAGGEVEGPEALLCKFDRQWMPMARANRLVTANPRCGMTWGLSFKHGLNILRDT